MKRSKKVTAFAVVAGVLAASSGTAYAGWYYNARTQVTLYVGGGGYANGAVAATRDSSNSSEYITCLVGVNSSGSAFGNCSARDAEGDFLACNATAAQLDQIRAISPSSQITFYANASGTCTTITVTQSSAHTASHSSGGGLIFAQY